MAIQNNLAQVLTPGTDGEYLQYLTFELDNELYGVNILSVQEIKGWEGVRQVPDMPVYVPGVIDLRGIIVPIMDLRLRFGLQAREYSAVTVVIIVATRHSDEIVPLGLIVDGVSDVMDVSEKSIKPPPLIGEDKRSQFMSGLVSTDKRMIVVLDIGKLLTEKILHCE